MVGHFQTLLSGIINQPDTPISQLPLLTEAERHQLVTAWNQTEISYDLEVSLIERFETQVERTPTAPAFIMGQQTLTYRHLNHQANRLAHHLQAAGVQPGMRVALCLPRSFEAIVGLLAIFKVGGIYLPLDPTYPAERLMFMLQDAEVSMLITEQRFVDIFGNNNLPIVCLDTEAEAIKQGSATNPNVLCLPSDPAYIIYTSGSTGQPKGALIPHKQILNRLLWMWESYPFAPHEVSCHKTALSFVDALWEQLGPLLQGSPTVIIPDEVLQEPTTFIQTLAEHKVTRLWLVPSLLRVILDTVPALQSHLPRLDFWVSSGEALPTELLQRFQQAMPQATLYNLYGTSEVWDVTWYIPKPDHAHLVQTPIGRPISNITTYILDDACQPVPIGVIGELWVGGVGLADTYLNQPQLTAERFKPSPFPNTAQANLYRSGDLARYLGPNGYWRL
jgi:amino acid adenylation domain-containing protein